PIDDRNPVAWRGFERRIGKECKEQRESEMNRAGFSIVEYTEAEDERKRRGIPELEQRPGDSSHQQHLARQTSGISASGIGFGHKLFEVNVFLMRFLFAHHALPLLFLLLSAGPLEPADCKG